ncbi:uncharacterized protein LOC115746690 isoform X2 [Rhodamnia argentea]|uniref:Uncharacterized protein LOC115746690 isoform X2 n=1 Tax=Rhodamnia argentea TaxID=178133 RepID=A0ABM3HAX2_9MYRT|nr:uncharacterized protein LOC115746690 isoform X2 [Rhodamnia argentea]
METVKASSQDCLGTTEGADKEGCLEDTTVDEDFLDLFGLLKHYRRTADQSETRDRPTVKVNEEYRELFSATVRGHWKSVNEILLKDSKAMAAGVMTIEGQSVTVLDIAVVAAQDQLVEKLVKSMHLNNENGILERALCNAAQGGRIRIVEALVDKISDESTISRALSTAVSWAPTQKEVIWYLAGRTSPASTPDVSSLIMAGHLDIAWYLTWRRRQSPTNGETELDRQLGNLVSMMSYFHSRATLSFWEKSISKCIPQFLIHTPFATSKAMDRVPVIKRIVDTKLRHQWSSAFGHLALSEKMISEEAPKTLEFLLTSGIVLDAASRGISEFVELCLRYFPELMWEKNFTKELIKEVVKGRHVELFRLVNAYNITPYLTDDKQTRCELMEAVVEWSPGGITADVSGAAFLTQRELQWFKVVEDRSHPSLKSMKFKVLNEDCSDPSFKSLKLEETKKRTGKTYWEVFVAQRQDLLKEARQWMKDMSSSCSLVATLIITVAFAAAFTVPGGNDSSTGIPIFLQRGSFIVFAIADALALFSSVTATLMFLAIITSRYAIDDFLRSLPRKMILGLTFLFLSLAFMLVAFGSALTIVLSERLKWIYIPITLLAALPVILFAILQLPLYFEMVESTYWPPLYRPKKLWK